MYESAYDGMAHKQMVSAGQHKVGIYESIYHLSVYLLPNRSTETGTNDVKYIIIL